MANTVTGYIINNAKTNCHYLVYDGEKHIWKKKGDGELVTSEMNKNHPSVFDTQEDAYGYAYNVANLENNEFTIQEIYYDKAYYKNK